MTGNSILLAVILTVMSVMSLSLLSLLCLRCKRKSKIVEVEHQIYNQQTFHHRGSRFAVTRSKTVTRDNQTISTRIESGEEISRATVDESDYQNVSAASETESLEHDYVAPLPIPLYANEEFGKRTDDAHQEIGVYGNIQEQNIQDSPYEEYDNDYENSGYIEEVKVGQVHSTELPGRVEADEVDEPDYVNEMGE